MKQLIFGLDLGTTSIGWAVVNENRGNINENKIIDCGSRVIPLTVDEHNNFKKGASITTNAERTLKRSARRNLQRFKLRRENLIEILTQNNFINSDSILTENGNNTTHQTLFIRAKAAKEKVSKEEFARVLLAINKKRGYKSSRKEVKSDDDGFVDSSQTAKYLYENNLTPGEYTFGLLSKNQKFIPDFYPSDLQNELKKIWETQQHFYPKILSNELFEKIQNKNKTTTWAILKDPFGIEGIKLKGKSGEVKQQKYNLRVTALKEKINLEHLAIVFQEINNQINKTSGYLGKISDRSKQLYINKITVGEFLYNQIKKNPNTRIKGQVFYRQDYLDEFETIWETQKKHHPELNPKLKDEIRDVIIFYQRRLKSQKGLIANCEFEYLEKDIITDGIKERRRFNIKVCPKSSPLFQEFKIWQQLNNLEVTNKITFKKEKLNEEDRATLAEHLSLNNKIKDKDILKLLGLNTKEWELNFPEIKGNSTLTKLYKAFQKIAEYEGYGQDWNKKTLHEINQELEAVFNDKGITKNIFQFNAFLQGEAFQNQPLYKLWHILYSAEEDFKKITPSDIEKYGSEMVTLKKTLCREFGFAPYHAKTLAQVTFKSEYGSLSSKAIKKILPFLKEGHIYSEACALAGYNHSNSLTKEENEKRPLKDTLEILPKNSLRNPVVEKILNQKINVVNALIEKYGHPDEIRVELGRDLKKSAKERDILTKNISKANKLHEKIERILKNEFGIPNPTRNDIIKYKLYTELKDNGYKTLYTNKHIPKEKLYSKEIDIEHIIPKARLFDDSYSNKTLAYREVNLKKGNLTAIDFIEQHLPNEVNEYKERINSFLKHNPHLKAKYAKLLMPESKIPEDFLARDLANTRYISKKAQEILKEICRTVTPTTGKITAKLRNDWGLINVLKDLNKDKYKQAELIELQERKNGQKIEKLKDWTKRNDHRHHAMDAITVAFTTNSHVQYLSNKNATENKESKLYGLKEKLTEVKETKNGNKKRAFISPMNNMRKEVKNSLQNILVSHKAKNKVVTKNINKIKIKSTTINKEQLTPRGALHKETVYGKRLIEEVKIEKITSKFDYQKILTVTKPTIKKALLERLEKFGGDPKKAFGGKNSLSKNPVIINGKKIETCKTKTFTPNYTIKKEITKDLKLDKVLDSKIKILLEKRLKEYGGDSNKAFTGLDENPIWLNKEKNISIKSVRIKGVDKVEALHHKKDHNGNTITTNGKEHPSSFVQTGGNHHVAIFKDENGKYQEQLVSFYEAVACAKQELPIINKNFNQSLGWEFQFSMKQNELFIFPSEGFNPNTIDLLNPKNKNLISPHLFRVQKFSSKDYFFRHHLETTVNDVKELKGVTWKRIRNTDGLKGIIKVRVNHLGDIVQVGEY